MHKKKFFVSTVLFLSTLSYAAEELNQENLNSQNLPSDFNEEGDDLAYTRRHKTRDDREDFRKGGRKFPKRSLPSSEGE